MSRKNVSCYPLSSSNSLLIFQSYTLGSNDNCISCSDSHNLISVIREIVMVSCWVAAIVKVILWDIIIIVFIVWVVIFAIAIT